MTQSKSFTFSGPHVLSWSNGEVSPPELKSHMKHSGHGRRTQVSFLRLPLGHSGLILTLSNAARASLPSPHLLVVGAGVCAASLMGELPSDLICGFYASRSPRQEWPPRRGRAAEGPSRLPWEGAKELHWVPWADCGSQWRGGEPQRLSGQLRPGSEVSHGLSP